MNFDFLDNVIDVELGQAKVDKSKWRRCIFDLEGSLSLGGDIVQVANIMTDWDFNITGITNLYFKNNYPISAEELAIHGITEEFLKTNAKGHFTDHYIDTCLNLNIPTMYISFTLFDIRRINEELSSYGRELMPFGEEAFSLESPVALGNNKHFNAFSLSGKRKLVSVAAKIPREYISDLFKEVNKFIKFDGAKAHDALYDSIITLALCRRNYNVKDGGST